MGYYTYREMTAKYTSNHQKVDEQKEKEILRDITRIHLAHQDFSEADILSMLESRSWEYECPMNDTQKWYEADNDMREVSKLHPDCYILVDCTGEDHERWADYYWNGRKQEDVLIVTMKPVDLAAMADGGQNE
jgi:hypothetical protein